MNNILNKLTNTKTVLGIASAVILILTTVGVKVDSVAVMTIVKVLCGVGVSLGIMNDTGMETPEWNK
jgi:hypothetical protein